ncbi:MAG: hypothetical protein HY718_02985 [Planctomycetes bacterium]|nr:hypothetical protein [Planctomycetota bacterium]
MTDTREPIEYLLLDLHLEQLEAEQAAAVRQSLDTSPDLAEKNKRLTEVLSVLDRCPTPQPRTGLADAVLARVQAQTAIYPFNKAASALPAGSAQDLSASPVLSLRELIAIAACITLFVGIFVPGYFKAQSIALRNRCLDNLRQVWGGASEFAEANNGQLAHAGFVPGGSWLPTRVPNVQRFSNTAYMYRLVKEGYVRDTMVFVCPAVPNGRPMRADSYRDFDDFAEPANTTYSYLFMNVPKPVRSASLQRGMVLAGDSNPLFNGRSVVQLNPYDENSGNSPAHGGTGQCVVYVTGSAGWFQQPTVGVDHDNIYRAGRLLHYQGTEIPLFPTDTFVIP